MNCKCEEMEMLKEKLERLSVAKRTLEGYDANISLYAYKTEGLCRGVGIALYSTHANNIQASLRKKTNLFHPISAVLKGKIDAKIAELSREYGALKMADDAYHEKMEVEDVSD